MRSRGLTILPIALALTFMMMASLTVVAVILSARARVLEEAAHQKASPIERKQAWVRVYVYNASLCRLLQLWYMALQNITDTNMTLSELALDPPRILVLNVGGSPIRVDYLAASALGTVVHEQALDRVLEPGGYLAYEPSELGLPSDYETLARSLDALIIHTDKGEAYVEASFTPPDPVTVVEVGEDGSCSEP